MWSVFDLGQLNMNYFPLILKGKEVLLFHNDPCYQKSEDIHSRLYFEPRINHSTDSLNVYAKSHLKDLTNQLPSTLKESSSILEGSIFKHKIV